MARRVRITPEGLEVDGSAIAFRSIGLPYWALSPEDWDPVMQGVTALRVPVLRVDVPWSLHEPTPGVYDWGESRPQLALDRVLELASERGLLVVVRPGPWLGRPHAGGGIPGWLLDADHTLAVDASGRQLRVPSVASTRVRTEVRRWLEAVVERLRGHFYPQGAVVALSITEIGPTWPWSVPRRPAWPTWPVRAVRRRRAAPAGARRSWDS